jgi:hypothetical protein
VLPPARRAAVARATGCEAASRLGAYDKGWLAPASTLAGRYGCDGETVRQALKRAGVRSGLHGSDLSHRS